MTAPHWYEVVIGCAAVICGCLLASWTLWFAVHDRNWLMAVIAAGAVIFVAGVVFQQAPATAGSTVNLWTASITVPIVEIVISQVAVAGLLVALVGISLVLFFERVIPEDARRRPALHRPLEEDDRV
jgi:hypothetical protein